MSAQMAGLLVLAVSIAPSGLCLLHNITHGWRRGLHSYAASRLGRFPETDVCDLPGVARS